MKKLLHFLALTFASTGMFAQDFGLIYEPEFATQHVVMRDLYKTSDNNLLIGYDIMTGSVPKAGIMKTNIDGSIIWSKHLNIPGSLAGCSFEALENAEGNYYLWGLNKKGASNMAAILCEISTDGELLWTKEYDFGVNISTAYTVNKIHLLPSGDLQMMIAVYSQVIILKTNGDGEIIWGKSSSVGPPDGGSKNPGFEWLAIPDDGGICASKASNDLSLLRYSADGELLWNRTYNMGYTHGKSIVRAPNGNLLISGFISSTPHVMEVSEEDGSISWIKRFDGLSMILSDKSHLTVVDDEITLDFSTSDRSHYIVKLDNDGNAIETMIATNKVFDYNKIEIVSQDENYFYGSMKEGTKSYGMIHRVSNLFEESCLITAIDPLVQSDFLAFSEVDFIPEQSDFTAEAAIDVTLEDQPFRVKIVCAYLSAEENELNNISVYPNPSTDQITVTVSDNLLNATYYITDLSGKQVMVNNVNSNQMQIDISTLSNGQYILSIQSENEVLTKKITVLK